MTSGAPGPRHRGAVEGLRLWRELAGGLVVFAVYATVSSLDWPTREVEAARHSRDVFALERAIGVDVELALNNWLAPRALLRTLANYEYATTYVISAFALLGWLYLRRPAMYRWARTSFIMLNLGGVICFALYPMTPPRLMAGLGFTDTVRLGHTWGSWGSPMVSHANQLAAMPSLHVAWAFWVSIVLARISGGLVVQTTSAIHVLVTVLVIMATANHYLLDAVAGAALAFACVRSPWPLRRKAPPSCAPPPTLTGQGLPDRLKKDATLREGTEGKIVTDPVQSLDPTGQSIMVRLDESPWSSPPSRCRDERPADGPGP